MASIDFTALAAPVSDQEPCGQDLDLIGDPDYMNCIARTEGVLPATFFSGPEGKPFDRTSIDFAAEFAAIAPLLERTRDIRLLVLVAKLLVLNRDLPGFVGCVGLVDALLQERWDDVHPRGLTATSRSAWPRSSRSTTCRPWSSRCSTCRLPITAGSAR